MGGISPRRVAAQADVEFWTAWSSALQQVDCNQYGVETRRFGEVVAVLAHGAPVPFFNRILGFTSGDLGLLTEIATFYRERQTPWRLDVGRPSRVMDRHLLSHGMEVIEEQANLAARLKRPIEESASAVRVEEVGTDQIGEFISVYDIAYNGDDSRPGLARFRLDSLSARFERPGWRFYSAALDDEVVGGAILFVSGRTATLGGGATLPEARGRGCQGALLRRRLADASAAGCNVVVSRCRPGSASHRNLRRVGLEDVYTKRVWSFVESAWSRPISERGSVITAA